MRQGRLVEAGLTASPALLGRSAQPAPKAPPGPTDSQVTAPVTATTPFNAPLGTVASATATCADGKKILGGGFTLTVSLAGQESRARPRESYPSAPNAWTGSLVITSGLVGAQASISVYAVCTV